jgi:lysozyme family protein
MSFEQAYKFTRQTEGGYALVKGDPGGETYRGITRRRHKAWDGWTKVDEAKSIFGVNPKKIDEYLKGDEALSTSVELLYRTKYWDPIGELPDLVKMKTFDISVNAGMEPAVTILQKALQKLGAKLDDDGKLGPITRAAAKAFAQGEIVEAMCARQAMYYRRLVEINPVLKKFLNGWLKRAEWRPLGED